MDPFMIAVSVWVAIGVASSGWFWWSMVLDEGGITGALILGLIPLLVLGAVFGQAFLFVFVCVRLSLLSSGFMDRRIIKVGRK